MSQRGVGGCLDDLGASVSCLEAACRRLSLGVARSRLDGTVEWHYQDEEREKLHCEHLLASEGV